MTALLVAAALLVLSQLYGGVVLGDAVAADLSGGAHAELFVVVFAIAYAAGFLAWGPVVDRAGPERVMVVGLLALAVPTLLIAIVPSYPAVLALRAVQGALAASFAPAAFAQALADDGGAGRGRLTGVLTSAFLAAAVLGQVGAHVVLALASWRWFFAFGAAPAVLVAVVIGRGRWSPAARAGAIAPVVGPAGAPPSVPGRDGSMPSRTGGRGPASPGAGRALVLLACASAVLGPLIALTSTLAASVPADALLWLRASALPALVWVPFAGRRLRRIPATRRLSIAFVVASAAAAGLALGGGPLATGVLLFVVSAAVAVLAPSAVEALGALGAWGRGVVSARYTFALFAGVSAWTWATAAAGLTLAGCAVAACVAFALAAAASAWPGRGRRPARSLIRDRRGPGTRPWGRGERSRRYGAGPGET